MTRGDQKSMRSPSWDKQAIRCEPSFDDCEVTVGHGTTTLRAELPDRGALPGLVERISSLGLHVIDVSLVAPGPLPARVTHLG